ncbi:MAG: ATP-binding protein [Bacteroidetes bacterium]|nr:ATP-binding protein [Bacteroidota bacterium]
MAIRHTIITSQLRKKHWYDVIDELVMADDMMDHIFHHNH